MTVYYCAVTLGGTSRGVGILRALGEGVLVTPYRRIAMMEELPYFGQVPLPQSDDVLIYDRFFEPRDRGKRVTVGRDGNVDLVIDWPVVSHAPDSLDMDRAKTWWEAPIMVGGNLAHSIMEPPPKEKILACRGGKPNQTAEYMARVKQASPSARTVSMRDRTFYWPAIELMALADEVIGERQVQNEWAVAKGEVDPDGARIAADKIMSLIK